MPVRPIKIQGYDNKPKIYTIFLRINFHQHAHFIAATDTHSIYYKCEIIKIKALYEC